ncbi:hypothetical protein Aph02nite_42650 [Actinoplanes philippinensis]|uniref:Uncharacterized protein n=1 Tax=Actinoplanes philippinensis TaxID=35752 RepID=A0A1I2H2C3_9ACTN|nr:hypothetical protein [Actinoplanes philippinensis]GIE78315.1 hypothetical protein Aph02nite_42650 [Actinoplanes philippinensis]SFF23688.1 hypothetical protein SAMN05421541_107395 [Actinoplanes philippinensis]
MIQLRNHAGPDNLRTVTPADPAEAYRAADPADCPLFFRGDDPLLQVWIVDDTRCQVVRREGGRWYDLIDSDAAGDVEVLLGGWPSLVPAASVVHRDRGLELLRTTGDLAGCTWRPVPAWVVDRGSSLMRDVVDAHWEQAVDLHWDMMFDDEPGDGVSPGLRGLAWLSGIHNKTMADGLHDAVEAHTPEQLDEAVAFATRVGLHEIAALITFARTAEPSDEHSEQYWHLSGWPERDAGAVLDAIRRDIADDPAHWGLA